MPETPAATRVSDTRTLVVGEALIDAVTTPDGATTEHVGGSPANVAFGLAALEHPVDLATWIGHDARGERIAAHCAERGVTLTEGSRDAGATSLAHATLDASGAATYVFDLEWHVAPVPNLQAYGHVHTGSIAAVIEPFSSSSVHPVGDSRAVWPKSHDRRGRSHRHRSGTASRAADRLPRR